MGVGQSWRKENSRSYLTDLSAMACQAGDQRSMAQHIINKFSKKIVFTMNGVDRGALI